VVASLEDAEKDDFEENHDILEDHEEAVPTSTAAASTVAADKAVVVPNVSTTSSTEQPHEGIDDAQEHPLNEKPARRWWSCGCF
jgi:hypothetical protein